MYWLSEGRRRPPVAATLVLTLLAACAPGRTISNGCPRTLPHLINLETLNPAPITEVRYATAENFTGAPLPGYEEPVALLRPDAARALERVAARLRAQGLGLKVWDAYRPARASRAMVQWARRTSNDWVVEEGYVAPESGHNRGNTVDLTLVSLESGAELDMGTGYDEFTPEAHTAASSGEVLANRMTLVREMEAEGWENYPLEWWHFSFPSTAQPLDVPLTCWS